jgi:hypothetical protein
MSPETEPGRYYTIDEANAALGRLTERFGRVMQARSQLKTLYARFVAAGVTPTFELARGTGEGESGDPTLQRDAAMFHGLIEVVNDELEAIAAEGVQIKDVEIGLCDWPALHQGREILLCWKLGEPEVGWFHELETGFAGRRPVAELER